MDQFSIALPFALKTGFVLDPSDVLPTSFDSEANQPT